MRIAITGKGGSGKTMVAGTLARHLARRGHKVVAVDADPSPNLGISLGVPRDTVETMQPILNALLADGYTHDQPRPPADDLLARYGLEGPEGILLVATGKIERPSGACLCCGSHNTTRQFFAELPADDRVVVADLEAGLNDLIWAQPGDGDVVLVMTETSAKSVEIARRAVQLARQMGVEHILGVANRTRTEEAATDVAAALGVPTLRIPDDPAVLRADHLGVAPIDEDPTSPAVVAVDAVLSRILAVARDSPARPR